MSKVLSIPECSLVAARTRDETTAGVYAKREELKQKQQQLFYKFLPALQETIKKAAGKGNHNVKVIVNHEYVEIIHLLVVSLESGGFYVQPTLTIHADVCLEIMW